MADVNFNAAVAIDVQDSGFGTIDATIRDLDLTTGLDSSNGLVLGDYDAGDGRSGIVVPSRVPLIRERPGVGRTRTAPSFRWTDIEGLQIVYPVKGNGAAATPSVGEAVPLMGLHALNQMAGMYGANGGAGAEYDYVPGTALQQKYGTIKLWVGDTGYVYQDCVVGSRSTVFTPGEPAMRTDSILVGSLVTASVVTGMTWPTGANAPDYTTQASMSAPPVEGAANIWGHTRGFNELTIDYNNNMEKVGDSNVDITGMRYIPGEVEIIASGILYREDTSDDDFEWQQSIYGEAATTFNFQIGTAAGATDIMNAFKITMPTPRANSIRDVAINETLVGDEFEVRCRGATESSEYEEMYN